MMSNTLREEELQLREELDLAQAKTREVTRARDAAYEIVADHEVRSKTKASNGF